jgi:hypothetical protein
MTVELTHIYLAFCSFFVRVFMVSSSKIQRLAALVFLVPHGQNLDMIASLQKARLKMGKYGSQVQQ